MDIEVRVIDHQQQRYETCGDWWHDPNDDLVVAVSKLDDWRLETLVAVHEIVEAAILKHRGIPEADVTAFDIAFEEARVAGQRATTDDHPEGDFPFRGRHYPADAEPGDSPDAPYKEEHCFATAVERILCAALGVDWAAYEQAVNGLPMWNPGGHA